MGEPMESRDKAVMTVLELCQYLQMSEAKVREMLRQGTIPAVLIGRQWRIRKSAVDRWMAEQEQAVKVIRRQGGQRRVIERGDRLAKAIEYDPEELNMIQDDPEDLPSPKPPRPPRTVEKADPGARTPPSAPTPAEVSPAARRKMAQDAIKRDRAQTRAKGRA